MGVKVKGVRQAQQNLNRLVDDIQGRKAVRAMTRALIHGGEMASLYTPIATSTLINSQYRQIDFKGTRLTGRLGYSASYAVYVHDPNIPQNFRRSTAQKEFLTKGFDDARDLIDKAICEEMRL